ncbi:MAG: ABC transporter permease [Caldilineaceae bacterium]|nr:ABC transporter permease [Caldilineaceae bacterium]
MNRLISSLRWETQIQFRQGIYYAAAFIAVMWSAVLFSIPDSAIEPLLVSVLFLDLSVFGFFFMAGLYYLEKGDRVLEGLVVTPLRIWEYLTAKVATLTVVAVIVGAVVTLVTYGVGINWGWYVVAVVAMSAPLTLFGFVIAARYNGINEYLLPAVLYLSVMQIPLVGYFHLWDGWLLYLIPSTPGMVLLEAAFGNVPLWEIGYALIYLAALTVVSYIWAQRTFENVIARKVGG